MDTTTPNIDHTGAAGLPRAVWIGGGLMALTIVALATTLVMKNNDALPDAAVAATPALAIPAAPLAAASTTPGEPTTPQSSVANPPAVVAPPVAQRPAPVHEAMRPVHRAPTRVAADKSWSDAPQRVAAAPVCTTCGVIEGYSAVQLRGQNNGVGAVAGGLGGALVGSQIAGRRNHTLGGIIGAVGGGLLGNAIESHQRMVTVYDVRVRMADGSTRIIRESQVPTVGEHVTVEGQAMRPLGGQG